MRKKYLVRYQDDHYGEVVVEAVDEEEAEKRVEEMAAENKLLFDRSGIRVYEVEEQ